jgi:hypothetical protein
MLMTRQQNAEQNHNIKTACGYFENEKTLGYFGTTLTNQNLIRRKIEQIKLI